MKENQVRFSCRAVLTGMWQRPEDFTGHQRKLRQEGSTLRFSVAQHKDNVNTQFRKASASFPSAVSTM